MFASTKHLRLSGIGAVAGATLLLLAFLHGIVLPWWEFSATFLRDLFLRTQLTLFVAGFAATLLSLPGIHAPQAKKLGAFGYVALAAVLLAHVVPAVIFADAFTGPAGREISREITDESAVVHEPRLYAIFDAVLWVVPVGHVLFGVAVSMGMAYSRVWGALLVLSGVLALVGLPVPLAPIAILGLGWALLRRAARERPTAPDLSPA